MLSLSFFLCQDFRKEASSESVQFQHLLDVHYSIPNTKKWAVAWIQNYLVWIEIRP